MQKVYIQNFLGHPVFEFSSWKWDIFVWFSNIANALDCSDNLIVFPFFFLFLVLKILLCKNEVNIMKVLMPQWKLNMKKVVAGMQ